MDPWYKVDYSRHIREVSMELEGLPEVNPPSTRVPRQRLLAAPILKRRRQRNREEIGKRGSLPRDSSTGGKYRGKGQPREPPGAQAPPCHATRAPRALVDPLRLPLYYSGSFWCADF